MRPVQSTISYMRREEHNSEFPSFIYSCIYAGAQISSVAYWLSIDGLSVFVACVTWFCVLYVIYLLRLRIDTCCDSAERNMPRNLRFERNIMLFLCGVCTTYMIFHCDGRLCLDCWWSSMTHKVKSTQKTAATRVLIHLRCMRSENQYWNESSSFSIRQCCRIGGNGDVVYETWRRRWTRMDRHSVIVDKFL